MIGARLSAIAAGIAFLGRVAAVAGSAFIVLLTLADVTLRALLNRPILGASEMTASALALLVGAGFILCAGNDGHIRITLFESRLRRLLPDAVYYGWIHLWEIASTVFLVVLMGQYARHLFANFEYAPVLDYPLGAVFVGVTALTGLSAALLLLRLLGKGARQ